MVKFATKAIKLASRDEAKLWIIDNQFGRRNLPDIDRIALAQKREAILRPLAKVNRVESGKLTGRGNKKVSAKLPEPLDTRREAAKIAGVGERTYDAGKLVLDAAAKGEISNEDVEAIRRKEKSIHRVTGLGLFVRHLRYLAAPLGPASRYQTARAANASSTAADYTYFFRPSSNRRLGCLRGAGDWGFCSGCFCSGTCDRSGVKNRSRSTSRINHVARLAL